MAKIDEVYTAGEAAEIWGVSAATLKCCCSGQKGLPPRFNPGEFRKSGRSWLVTYEGMVRLYGEPKKE